MREIKFRAWDEKTKGFYYWNLRDKMKNIIIEPSLSDDIHQFTGLKDKNGTEIYEGDILKAHGIVAWNDVEHCWSRIDLNWNDKREWHNIDSLTSPMEIIGNIYQNPELINEN